MAHHKKEPVTQLDYNTLKKILDHSFDEIYVTNAEGIVIYVNNAAERHYGVKASEIIGKSSQEISEKKLWGPRVSPIAIKRKRSFTLEQKTCTGKTLLTTATPIWDEEGHLELVIENSRDITEPEGLKFELDKSTQLLKRYKTEVEELRKKEMSTPDFIVRSKKMSDLLELAQRIASVESTVLLLGESGTGKGIVAKYIHKNSSRKNGPFIPINCASIPSELMESELFGYAKGAFTGAHEKGKLGLIELANDGTLFLDEIGELPMKMQAKLLQVLQDNQYFKVGGREVQQANCRIIAATNRNLKEMVEKGEFREDLYYRLNVFEIEIPPLREREEEIIPLIHYFLDKYNNKYRVSHQISQNCLNILSSYWWPGNIRELENTIERLVVVAPETIINESHLPRHLLDNSQKHESLILFPKAVPLDEAINEVEKNLIEKAYKELGSSYEVAKALKTSQSKASRLIRKYCTNREKTS
ncbi:sigma-54 interaction domain-containing protein [Candidatus Formimonas warabiya]|uniref:Histidine kinase n=1 Tax=Formimonas warabiya TaxID=1761012 RepID=A0A3G1L0E6_FORW1|nr:sigma 54-interacting transcriptional regulator [Candidatus Formimonas warabiya]ATW28114.1 histidine kinase [Candidatus Formimonas warabiya]